MPSQVTIELQRLLEARDAKGLAKYGVTLDRVDLNAVEWIDHTIQELLDAAGYLMSLRREIIARNDELQELYDDGFHNPPNCGYCGQRLTPVRPGKHQCDNPNCNGNHPSAE